MKLFVCTLPAFLLIRDKLFDDLASAGSESLVCEFL